MLFFSFFLAGLLICISFFYLTLERINGQSYSFPSFDAAITVNTSEDAEFIENAISYLVDGEGLIEIRTRELKIRLLDMNKVNNDALLWQIVNVVLPSAVMVVFGFILAFIRKRKYAK